MKNPDGTRQHRINKEIATKLICGALSTSMCISFASCSGIPADTIVATTSEIETTVTTLAPTSTPTPTPIPEPTEPAPFSREYAYRIYPGKDKSVAVYMNVNIDDYITIEDDKEVFDMYRLASDLGWREKGVYSYEDYVEAIARDPRQTKIGHSNWFEYKYDDHRAVFIINNYNDDIKGISGRQVSWISFDYLKNRAEMAYFDDVKTNYAHKKATIGFEKHFASIDYYISGQKIVCSREDAIVIAYGLWCFSQYPDDSSKFAERFEIFRRGKGVMLP